MSEKQSKKEPPFIITKRNPDFFQVDCPVCKQPVFVIQIEGGHYSFRYPTQTYYYGYDFSKFFTCQNPLCDCVFKITPKEEPVRDLMDAIKKSIEIFDSTEVFDKFDADHLLHLIKQDIKKFKGVVF